MKRYHGKVWFDNMIYIWGEDHEMIADRNPSEDQYLLRMRGVGRGATREEQKATAKRFTECWNACEGLESPLDLRKQRDELREALEWIAKRSSHDFEAVSSDVRKKAVEVLTKTKGSM